MRSRSFETSRQRLWHGLGVAVLCTACQSRTPPSPAPAEATAAPSSRTALAVSAPARSPAASSADVARDPPSFTDAEWAVIRELAPPVLPPPPKDVTNKYADDPAAAALGAKLFADPRFSGALIDQDNDGGPNSLGRKGETGKVACAGCHIPKSGFSDTRSTFQEISLGTGWTARRTPSLLDVGQAKLVGWGGRHSTLFGQIFTPLENPLEMNSSRLFAAQILKEHYQAEYEAVFGKGSLAPLADARRFPKLSPETTGCRLTRDVANPRALPPDPLYTCRGIPGDGADYDRMAKADKEIVTRVVVNMGKAIAAYLRTLSCGPGRFDAWVHGERDALTAAEQRGLKLFIGRARCVGCHSGPYFSDQKFYNVGVEERPTREGILNANDRGAAVDLAFATTDPLGVTGPYSDGVEPRIPPVGPEAEGAFRTPTLRCVNQRPSYMHSGLIPTLDGAVRHFAVGGQRSGYPGKNVLEPLDLSPQDLRDLTAFLRSLDPPKKKR